MKFLFSADWHVKLWSDRLIDESGIPMRLHEIFGVVDSMCQYARTNGIDTIIVGGDINDLKNIVHVRAFVLLKRLIDQYSDIQFIFLHGNHDSASREVEESAIELLNGPNNVKTIIETCREHDITFIPHSTHIIDDIRDAEENNILISHFGLSDAELSNGTSIRTSIRASDLRKFKVVLLGHYHKPQTVGHIHYVGSPIPLRRDEHNEEKRFLVVDTETLEIQAIPTVGYRKYYDFVIDEQFKDDPNAIKNLMKEVKKLRQDGHFVTVRNRLRECPVDLTKSDVAVVDEYEEEYQIRGITTAMSIPEQMKKFLEIMRVPENEWDEYMKQGLEVLGMVETQGDNVDEGRSESGDDIDSERCIEAV